LACNPFICSQTYSFSSLSYTNSVGATNVLGLNDEGQIVGTHSHHASMNYPFQGFIASTTFTKTLVNFQNIKILGSYTTSASGVNSVGQIVGSYQDKNSVSHGFLKDTAGFTTIDFPGASSTNAYGINSSGDIVGSYFPCAGSTGGTCGFVLSRGVFTSIAVPNSGPQPATVATAINDSGTVVGYLLTCSPTCPGARGFLLKDGAFAVFNYPGGTNTIPHGVSNTDEIVGDFTFSDFTIIHGFLLKNSNFIQLDWPNAWWTVPTGINSFGQIAGTYYTADNSFGNSPHNGFIATPLCNDVRDQLIKEYSDYGVTLFPTCTQLTQMAHSAYFTFSEINTPCPSQSTAEFSWALVRQPFVAPASSKYGLDAWRTAFGGPRIINAGYRDPAQNGLCGGVPSTSRHMYGDAADLQNQSRTEAEWSAMYQAAKVAHASWREDRNGPCGIGCVHADWRKREGAYVP
jgi:uncharacterized membrane protein